MVQINGQRIVTDYMLDGVHAESASSLQFVALHPAAGIGHLDSAIQQRINADLVLKYTPRLQFELDTSIAQGDHVLSVLDELDRESGSEDLDGDPGVDGAQDRPEHE